MQDEPTPTDLLKAVADFLRNEIVPVMKGHNAFKLRVGINALDLVTRQLALEQSGDAAEGARLKQLLGMDGAPRAKFDDYGRLRNAHEFGSTSSNVEP